MFNSETKQRYYVHEFPTASLLINQLMPRVRALIRNNPTLKQAVSGSIFSLRSVVNR